MKKAACGLLAASLALMAHGAVPTTAEGWYVPSGGFTRQSGSGTVWYLDGSGHEQETTVRVDDYGQISGDTLLFEDVALKTAYNALVKACEVEAYSMVQDEAIATIGANLHDMVNGGLFVDYVDTDGNTKSVIVQSSGAGEGSAKPAAAPPKSLDAGRAKADGTSIRKEQDGTLSLVWPAADGLHAATPGGWRPFAPGGEGGVPPDGISLGFVAAGAATNLQVKGFADQAACGENLHDLLAEGTGEDALGHEVLCRVTEDGGKALHYLPLGGARFAEPDGETIEAHAPDGGRKALRVKPGGAGRFLRTNGDGDGVEWALPVTSVVSGGGIEVETDEETGRVTLTADGELVAVESRATSDGATAFMAGRRVRFEAADDSCVRIDVAQGSSTNEIVVKFGVYYR